MKRYVRASKEQRQYLYDKLKSFETDDYQNRDGDYPESDIPDTIRVDSYGIECSFKNTSESSASYWLKDFLSDQGIYVNRDDIETRQDGDNEFYDDWVTAFWCFDNPYKE